MIAPRTVTEHGERRGAHHVRAGRRRRAHQRVELSVLRRAELDRARAARRQRGAATSRRSTRRSPGCGSSTCCTGPACRSTSCTRSSAPGATGAALVEQRRRHGVLHRLVRDRPARRARPRPTGWSACSSSSAARTRRTSCDDVDVEGAALAVAEGAFYNAGQSCSATERVVRARSDLGRFVDAFVEVVHGYRSAIPSDDATDVGPLARAEQLDVLDAQIADAVQRGAKVLVGRPRLDRPGNWFEPTVVVDVDDRMALMRDETFGPVIGVATWSRATTKRSRRMDDTEFGLGASVFTRDRARAERILAAARRRQRLLEHRRPLVRAPAVGRPPPLRPRRVDVGVRRAQLRAREGLAPAPAP